MSLPKAIKGIRFGLLSPDEVRKMSVQRIINPDTHDEEGIPIPQGLMDEALGTIEPGKRCATCKNKFGPCPGHFGHIELQRPIIHIGFNKTIYKILQVICRNCSRIMLEPKTIIQQARYLREYKDTTGTLDLIRLDEIWARAKKNRDALINPPKSRRGEDGSLEGCYHCGEIQHKVRLEKPTSYYEEYETAAGNKVTDKISALDVQNRLKNIPDDDALLLGIDTRHARPEWMVLDVLPVPPVCVRPSITLDSGIRSEDDLTHKLVDIIRINQRLFDNRESGAPQLIVEDLWDLLQYHVTTYLDNEVSGIPPARHRSGRALRTLTQRLKGKEGRFRSNLSGKRVDFSARTVISPDPLLSINQVGVPKKIAEILTVPERVTEWNIEEMRELVVQGPRGNPGVNYIFKGDRRVALRFVRDLSFIRDNLKPGDVVERHLRDGDIVLFNRQPSLHRMSIMAHEVKVMPHKTFRLNLCVCLSGDTELYTALGKVQIKDLIRDHKRYQPLSTSWDENKETYYSNVAKTHIISPSELGLRSFEVVTVSGRRIKATEEHPFYTERGQIRVGDLKIGDKLAIYPINYPEIDFFASPIVDKEEFKSVYSDGTAYLEERNLFGIPSSDPRRVVLARLCGYLVARDNGDNNKIVIAAPERKDIEKLQNDVLSLNFEAEEIQSDGVGYFFEIRSPEAVQYLRFLKGKTPVPSWVSKGTKMEKREFMRALFGHQMEEPHVQSNNCIGGLKLEVKLDRESLNFLEELEEMLNEFGIQARIDETEESYIFSIANDDRNVATFLSNVGFEYADQKEVGARYLTEYLNYRTEVIVTSGGQSLTKSYEEWQSTHVAGEGFVWDEVTEINEIYLPVAYDITTDDENHNFIAESFLTSNCRPYNADFDGDEMNLHVPQSEEARAEAHTLMKVQEQISTPRYGGPIIGAIQDFITAAFFLTKKETILDRRVASEYLTAAGINEMPSPDGHDKEGNPYWSGKTLFSTLLPRGLNYELKNKLCVCSRTQPDRQCLKEKCPTEGYVIIRNGKLISGVIDKSCFGAEVPNSVLHRILKEFGADATRKFLDGLTRMLIAHITRKGFSMGLDAVDVPKEGRKQIQDVILQGKKTVEELIEKMEKGELERIPGMTMIETLEGKIQDELATVRNKAGDISAEFLGMDNSAVIMAKIGARGNMLNLSQMSACVGQQSVRGNRIQRGYKGRTLPHFKPGDLTADAKGFVNASFRSGLSPVEFFMHACGGREGLVDTAVRTSNSGYMQRRLVNAMQDLSSNYDETVRNSTGEVIQFIFGEDNIDPAKSDNGKAVNLDVIFGKVLAKKEEAK